MGSLREDLERVAAGVRGVTQHPVEVVIEGDTRAVYVNFDYRQALVIETMILMGQVWTITACSWDQTGGLDATSELGQVRERYVLGIVKDFLDVQDENARKLEAILAERPED